MPFVVLTWTPLRRFAMDVRYQWREMTEKNVLFDYSYEELNCLGEEGGGSLTSIMTSYFESAGLFTPGEKFSLISVQPLQRNRNLDMKNLNLETCSHLMTSSSHS